MKRTITTQTEKGRLIISGFYFVPCLTRVPFLTVPP